MPRPEGKGGGSANAPGQNKQVTITNPATGETQSLLKKDIRTRREELKSNGWTGPGLDDDEVEELEEEGEDGGTV
jgi:hypothetical protein